MGELVRLEVDEASRVGTIRLDRPPVNALNAQVHGELLEVAAAAGRDERVGAGAGSLLSGAGDCDGRRGGRLAQRVRSCGQGPAEEFLAGPRGPGGTQRPQPPAGAGRGRCHGRSVRIVGVG